MFNGETSERDGRGSSKDKQQTKRVRERERISCTISNFHNLHKENASTKSFYCNNNIYATISTMVWVSPNRKVKEAFSFE